jgi:hypothetical protein
LKRGFPALAGLERPPAGCVHEAGLVTVGWACGVPIVCYTCELHRCAEVIS